MCLINKEKTADNQSGEAVEVASASAVLTSQILSCFLVSVGVEDLKITIQLFQKRFFSQLNSLLEIKLIM